MNGNGAVSSPQRGSLLSPFNLVTGVILLGSGGDLDGVLLTSSDGVAAQRPTLSLSLRCECASACDDAATSSSVVLATRAAAELGVEGGYSWDSGEGALPQNQQTGGDEQHFEPRLVSAPSLEGDDQGGDQHEDQRREGADGRQREPTSRRRFLTGQ